MDVREFLKAAFERFIGAPDIELPVMPVLLRVGETSEYALEAGTRADTVYALETFSLCPRAYLIKHLAQKPLSIPFYAQVTEAVRETIAGVARRELSGENQASWFETRFNELVKGPFPIHKGEKDWKGDWLVAVKNAFNGFSPLWKEEGWQVFDVARPVSVELCGRSFTGALDVILKNDAGEYAVVACDHGTTVYRRQDGSLTGDEECIAVLERLKRRLYLYGQALEKDVLNAQGKIKKLMLFFYKPKGGQRAFVQTYDWLADEASAAVAWGEKMVEGIRYATESRQWPASLFFRVDGTGVLKEDRNFCLQRCEHCIACRWAGWHPESIEAFSDGTKVVQIPQKYVGTKIELKPGLDEAEEVLSYKGTFTRADGRVCKATLAKKVFQLLGVKTVGDLRGKSIFDFAAVPGCGVAKLDTILGLFFDVS